MLMFLITEQGRFYFILSMYDFNVNLNFMHRVEDCVYSSPDVILWYSCSCDTMVTRIMYYTQYFRNKFLDEIIVSIY